MIQHLVYASVILNTWSGYGLLPYCVPDSLNNRLDLVLFKITARINRQCRPWFRSHKVARFRV